MTRTWKLEDGLKIIHNRMEMEIPTAATTLRIVWQVNEQTDNWREAMLRRTRSKARKEHHGRLLHDSRTWRKIINKIMDDQSTSIAGTLSLYHWNTQLRIVKLSWRKYQVVDALDLDRSSQHISKERQKVISHIMMRKWLIAEIRQKQSIDLKRDHKS